jgi:hypothetical protein
VVSRAEAAAPLASTAEVAPARQAPVARPVRPPRLGTVVRTALSDYFFHSFGLVAVNVAWGAGLVLIVLVALVWPVGGLVLLPLLAVLTAIVGRAAARIVRAADDNLRTAPLLDRRLAGRALAVGAGVVAAGSVLVANVALGLGRADPIGWGLATLAGWGLVALAGTLLVGWPLLVDPARHGRSLREMADTTGRLLVLHPGAIARLGLAVALVLAVSVVLAAAILTVSLSFVALLLCRSVYPLADSFDPVAAGAPRLP